MIELILWGYAGTSVAAALIALRLCIRHEQISDLADGFLVGIVVLCLAPFWPLAVVGYLLYLIAQHLETSR